MKTDRELLELAARAAGLQTRWSDVWNSYQRYVGPVDEPFSDWLPWRPLADDGDALRLAVKLNLLVDCASQCARPLPDELGWFDGEANEDDLTATRRAIVRAAAEIGAQVAAQQNGESKP